MQRLKVEVMKAAIKVGEVDTYHLMAVNAFQLNVIVKMAPPAYKSLIVTLLLGETGHPLNEVLDKMAELGDMGVWNAEERRRKRDENHEPNGNMVSRKDMFQALLRAGVKWDKIDSLPTSEIWEL